MSLSGDREEEKPSKAPAVAPKMAPTTFDDLTEDALGLIADNIAATCDLVSLLRTNKQLYQICLGRLYRVAGVTVGGGYDEIYVPMLSPSNKGLAHIRVLDMGVDQDNVNDGSYRQSQFILGMFLEVLQPNTLEEFIWRSWDPLTAENTKRLYRTQKKLKYLEAGGVEPAFSDKMIVDWQMDTIMDHVEELGLFLDSVGAMRLSSEMLLRLKKPLKKLIITSHMSTGDGAIAQDEYRDTSTRPGLLTSLVFAHMAPFDKATPIDLEELTLNDVYLRYPRDTFCKVLNFSNLTRLVLEKCKGAEVFLGELCRSTLLPTKITTLNFVHSDQTADDEALKVLEDFLSLTAGLKELAIDIQHTSRLPAIDKITHHARALRVLSIHAYEDPSCDPEHHYGNEDFATLCKSCTRLEELSIAAPPQEIYEKSNENYKAFKNSLMGPESALDSLYTLQITTWPTEESLTSNMPRGLYDMLLQAKALEFFRARERPEPKLPKLHLIEFGSEGCFHRRCIHSGSSATIFVRSRELAPDGRSHGSCVSVVPNWRQGKLCLPTEVLGVTMAKHKMPPAAVRGEDDYDPGFVPLGWKPSIHSDTELR